MEPVHTVEGIVAPLDRADIDTDQIIPKQFLKRIDRTGYGDVLFHDWRRRSDGSPDPDFVLNRPPWNEARILVAGGNFGCGSSREHAVWALADFGIGAVVAPSFADIFEANCIASGVVPVRLADAEVAALIDRSSRGEDAYRASVDVAARRLTGEGGFAASFPLDPFRQRCLLEGLDRIALTLEHEAEIRAYEAR